MTDPLEQRIIAIVQDALSDGPGGKVGVSSDDSMESIAAWDSLTFMSVFLAINEAFDIDPDFDDAIHYTSIEGIHAYLKEVTS